MLLQGLQLVYRQFLFLCKCEILSENRILFHNIIIILLVWAQWTIIASWLTTVKHTVYFVGGRILASPVGYILLHFHNAMIRSGSHEEKQAVDKSLACWLIRHDQLVCRKPLNLHFPLLLEKLSSYYNCVGQHNTEFFWKWQLSWFEKILSRGLVNQYCCL